MKRTNNTGKARVLEGAELSAIGILLPSANDATGDLEIGYSVTESFMGLLNLGRDYASSRLATWIQWRMGFCETSVEVYWHSTGICHNCELWAGRDFVKTCGPVFAAL